MTRRRGGFVVGFGSCWEGVAEEGGIAEVEGVVGGCLSRRRRRRGKLRGLVLVRW